MNRPTAARLALIDARIRAGRYPNCGSLARELEVSVPTVQRDLALLRDRMGAPLEYIPNRRGYHYASGDWVLPFPSLTARDFAGLHLATHLLRLVAGSALEQPVNRLVQKLAEAMPDGVSVGPQNATSMSFGLPHLRGDEAQVVAALEVLQEAMVSRRTIEMGYYSAYRDGWSHRRLDVYHLHYRDGAWYALGWCHWRQRVLTFAVDRMREPQLLALGFHVRPEFDAEAYLGTAWSLETGEPLTVVIRFSPGQARYIREWQWHATQEITPEPDGGLFLQVQVAGLSEMTRWVLQFGSGAEVVAPVALRELVAREVQALAGTYRLPLGVDDGRTDRVPNIGAHP